MTVQLQPETVQILNEEDYRKFRLPEELSNFGSLQTAFGFLPLREMQLRGEILGLVFACKLTQTFQNSYSQPLEAVYIFPLPARSAVSSFVMETASRRVEGVLQERGAARQAYAQAVASGKQAALAEEERAEVFTITVGNIPPGESVRIELELEGPLGWMDGEAMFRFPLVVAPRYTPGAALGDENVGSGTTDDTDAVPDASRISPPLLLPGYPNPVRLSVELQVQTAGLPFGLPSVSMADLRCCRRTGQEDGYTVTLQPLSNRLDRDLILRFPLQSSQIATSLHVQTSPRDSDLHHILLNLVPDSSHQAGPAVPRQVVALLDRSGSMSGWKMVCARRAVGRLIDSLNDADSFQVLNFDDRTEPLDPSRGGLRPASDRERFLTLESLGKVTERGGTEILPALEQGVQLLQGAAQPILLLITDGQVSNESETLRWMQTHARGIRVFTVGIDRAINQGLLEQMAQVSGGVFTLVESEEQLDHAMSGMCARINPPLLSNLAISLPGVQAAPARCELFQGACARLYASFRGPVPDQVEITALGRDGRPWQQAVAVSHSEGTTLQRLWGRARVSELEHGFLAGWSAPECQPAAIARFALEVGVLCRFTAFVAIDQQSYVPGTLRQETQAVSDASGGAQKKLSAPRGAAPLRRSEPAAGMAAPIRMSAPLSAGLPPAAAPCPAPPPPPPSPAPFEPATDPFSAAPEAFAADPFSSEPPPWAAAEMRRASPAPAPNSQQAARPASLPPRDALVGGKPTPRPAPSLLVQEALELLRSASDARFLGQALMGLHGALLQAGYRPEQLQHLVEAQAYWKGVNYLPRAQVSDEVRALVEWTERLLLTPPPAGRSGNFWS